MRPWWTGDRFWKIIGPVVFMLVLIAGTARLWVPLIF